MSVQEHDRLVERARHHLLDEDGDPNEYNAEMVWLARQPIDPS